MTEQELMLKAVELRKTAKSAEEFENGLKLLTEKDPVVDESGKPANYKIKYLNEQDNKMVDIEKTETPAPVIDTKAIGDIVSAEFKKLNLAGSITGGKDEQFESTFGFKNLAEYSKAIMGFTRHTHTDPRITKMLEWDSKAPSAYASGLVGQDGGFAIPPQMREQIWTIFNSYTAILPRTDVNPTQGDSIELAADQTTPWGSSGVQAYWVAEGNAATASKPNIQPRVIRLSDLIALIPATNQILADAPRLNDLISTKAALALRYLSDKSIFRGSGAGQPLGILNSPSFIQVAKDNGQDGGTVSATNIFKCYASMDPEMLEGAEWWVQNSVLPQLYGLTIGNVAAFLPVGGGISTLERTPVGQMLGKPVYVTQHASAVGTPGDVIFANWKGYASVKKADADEIKAETSIHLYFDLNMTAFRFVVRLGGEPYLSKAIVSDNGGLPFSHFVGIALRA